MTFEAMNARRKEEGAARREQLKAYIDAHGLHDMSTRRLAAALGVPYRLACEVLNAAKRERHEKRHNIQPRQQKRVWCMVFDDGVVPVNSYRAGMPQPRRFEFRTF